MSPPRSSVWSFPPSSGEAAAARPRILLVRTSAIGDILFASPLIAALRRAHPRAYLAWLVQPEHRALLERHPDLDEVVEWPRAKWQTLWRRRRFRELLGEVRTLRARLRARRFDLAIDLQGLLKSGFLTWLSGARQRLGLGSREGSQWLMTEVIPRGGDRGRIASEYRFLAECLGLPVEDFALALHPGPEEAKFAEDWIARAGLEAGYAVLCPFTTRPQKHWMEARWAALVPRLGAELGLPAVLLGGPSERAAAARLRARIDDSSQPGSLIDLTGATHLLQAAALIERSALVIAVDTGLGHMGIAFARPTLLLFGSTRPYLDTTRGNARVLYHPRPCSPCRRRPVCRGTFDCMRAIDLDEILAAARQVRETPP